MRIALLNEFSQSNKNPLIFETLKKVVKESEHTVYNVGMQKPLLSKDLPEAYTDENPRLTYLHLGVQAALLLNSQAVDFVLTGCGTGQGALMSLNSYPGVFCGYCIDPTDAFLFSQINNGNALSIPFAKGFGWGAEINLEMIIDRAINSSRGQGYPIENKASQNKNVHLLKQLRQTTTISLENILKKLDPEFLSTCLTPRFLECFHQGEYANAYLPILERIQNKQ